MRIGPALGALAGGLGLVGVCVAFAMHDEDNHVGTGTGSTPMPTPSPQPGPSPTPVHPGVPILSGDDTLGTGPTPDPTAPTTLHPDPIEHPEYLRAETKYATHGLHETTVSRFAEDLFGRYDHNGNGKIEIGDDVRGLQKDERVTGHEDAYYSLINTFQAADADKDDEVTRSELENYVSNFDTTGRDHPMFDGSYGDGKLGVSELKTFGMAEIQGHSDDSMEYDLIGVQQQVVDGAGVLHENHEFSRDLPEYRQWPDGVFGTR